MKEHIKKTIKVYDRIAAAHLKRTKKLDINLFYNPFLKQLAGKDILDVGCGGGRDCNFFHKKGFDVTGIDLSEGMLTVARKNTPKVKFLKMDMKKLDFPDASFNGIWASASLLHLEHKDALTALREFRRILKPKGILFVSVRKGTGTKIDHEGRIYILYTENELMDLLKSTGFEIIEKQVKRDPQGRNLQGQPISWIIILARVKRS